VIQTLAEKGKKILECANLSVEGADVTSHEAMENEAKWRGFERGP